MNYVFSLVIKKNYYRVAFKIKLWENVYTRNNYKYIIFIKKLQNHPGVRSIKECEIYQCDFI